MQPGRRFGAEGTPQHRLDRALIGEVGAARHLGDAVGDVVGDDGERVGGSSRRGAAARDRAAWRGRRRCGRGRDPRSSRCPAAARSGPRPRAARASGIRRRRRHRRRGWRRVCTRSDRCAAPAGPAPARSRAATAAASRRRRSGRATRGRRGSPPRCRAARVPRRRPRYAAAGVRRPGAPTATPLPRRRRSRGAAARMASAPVGPRSSARVSRNSRQSHRLTSVILSQPCQPPWIRRRRPGPGSRCRRASRRPVPGLRSGVVNCAAYEGGVRVADVEVADVHADPDHGRPLRLDRHVRAGRGAAARGPARVRPARSRRRGRAQRAPAAEVRGLRRLGVRGPAHGADERRAAAHPVRRDARVRRQELRRVGAARLAAVARRPAHPLRGDPGLLSQGPRLRPLRADGFHRRSILPDRRGARGRARRPRGRDLPRQRQPRHHHPHLPVEARAARRQARRLAARRGLQPPHAVRRRPDPRGHPALLPRRLRSRRSASTT